MSRVGGLACVGCRQNVAQPSRSVLKEERTPPGVEQAPDALAGLEPIAIARRRLVNGADTIREVAFDIDRSTQPQSPDWQPPGPRPRPPRTSARYRHAITSREDGQQPADRGAPDWPGLHGLVAWS